MAGVRTVKVEWTKDESGRWKMGEVEGSEKVTYHISHGIFRNMSPTDRLEC